MGVSFAQISGLGVTDHLALSNLAPGDAGHTGLLLLTGRAGGQTANGGTVAGEILTLRGRLGGPDSGRIDVQSPVDFSYDTASNTTPAESFAARWAPTASVASYIGGFLSVASLLTTTGAVYIPATFSDTGVTTVASALGFAVHTFINYLHRGQQSTQATALSCIAFNMGFNNQRTAAGTSTAAQVTGFSFSPTSSTTVAGAVMNKTLQTALRCSPTFNTVAGSSVALGTIAAVSCVEPAVALFGSGAGTETMTAYYGVNFANMTFGGGTATYSVIRSLLNAGTNKRFLDHTGTAVSRMRGNLFFDVDNVGVFYGSANNVATYWNSADAAYRVQFVANTTSVLMSNPASGRILWNNTIAVTAGSEFNFNCGKFSLGAQTGAVGNQVGVFIAGARSTTVNGGWSDFLLTQAANITINHTMSELFGWTINSPGITIGTGSITGPISGLNVGGMATVNIGTNISSALRVTGRSTLRGSLRFEPIAPANMTGSVTAWSGLLTATTNNNMRYWARFTCDAATTLRGIDSTAAKDGDTYEITNVGANNLAVTNEDGAAAAADRILIGAFGGTVVPNRTITIRYDATTARWRVVGR